MKILYTLIISMLFTALANAQARVRPGDSLNISIRGVPQDEQSQITGPYVVTPSGQLKLPYINGYISAKGSAATVARRIEGAYKKAQIYTTPTITIKSMRDARREDDATKRFITVSGQVGRPGPMSYREGMTLNEVVSGAVPNSFAALKRVRLLRKGKTYIYNVKRSDHMLLKIYPNDQITVPQLNIFNR